MIENKPEAVYFSVDANLVNRLGIELVGRAETAVSELIKNSYDADSTLVEVQFINTDKEGGTLIIEDNGHGMDKEQLKAGFLRIASQDKVENPLSERYNRQKAGRKGIGRFATQRLGTQLIVETKTKRSSTKITLTINWEKYDSNVDLQSVANKIETLPNNIRKESYTRLVISNLREKWTESSIKRVYRYVSNLLQPNYLSSLDKAKNIAKKSRDSFKVEFFKISNGNINSVADVDSMIFDHALGVIEGYVIDGKGICEIFSKRFKIKGETIELEKSYANLPEVHFKAYYYIYEKKYYPLNTTEYNDLKKFRDNNSGIKIYRNGFRVLPYGEKGNDWINIDSGSSQRTDENKYVPFSNYNFFGFVEIIDTEGEKFNETASREGLIENIPFNELKLFIHDALLASAKRVNSARPENKRREAKIERKYIGNNSHSIIEQLEERAEQKERDSQDANSEDSNENASDAKLFRAAIEEIKEVEMLRVLAGIGITVGEFTHEIHQFFPIFKGGIDELNNRLQDKDSKEIIQALKKSFSNFESYASYIDSTIRNNAHREKRPIDIVEIVEKFITTIKNDSSINNIEIELEKYGFDLFTRPMHPSEWNSILYNLYTNAKKAIGRENPQVGRIKIIIEKEEGNIYIEFMDNGDGIPPENVESIFNAFFTTSTESNRGSDSQIGMGLGLKIVNDIIYSYQGNIEVVEPVDDFSTSLRIRIKKATEQQIEEL